MVVTATANSSVTLIENIDHLVTVDDVDTVLEDASVLVVDGVIRAVGTAPEVERDLPPGVTPQHVDGRHRLMLPGLVNLHTHTPMTLLRGIAEDVDLQGFLARVWAAEAAVMDPETVMHGAELGALESLRAGSTTQLDMYFHHSAAHEGAVRVGTRHVTGPTALDFPGPDDLDWDSRLAALQEWPSRLAEMGGPYVPPASCPHATYTVSPERMRELAEVLAGWEHGLFTTHVSENAAENDDVLGRHGRTPTEILAGAGLLSMPHIPVVFGHGVHLNASDRATVSMVGRTGGAGVTVAHCPGSNLKLASGALSFETYRRDGVRLGIGTDGCSSSNDLDMWMAMRLTGLMAKLTTRDPAAGHATHVLRAATIEGARALGMGDRIGSIEVGKEADLVMIDIDAPHLIPIHDVPALLVYAAGRGDVTDVFVAGEWVLANRTGTRIDEAELRARCRERGAVAGAAARAAVEAL